MRAFRSLSVFCAVTTLVVMLPAVAGAGEIDLEDTVYGGIYSNKFLPEDDLNALAAAAGGKVTFAGMFHDVLAPDGSGGWSNVRESLNEAWLAHATPFVNIHVGSVSAAAIANGSYDSQINTYASRVQQYLNKGGGRSLIIAPMQEMNGTWTSYGCTPANFKAAYKRIVDIFRNRGIDETKVRWAFAPNGWTSPGCGSIAGYYPGDNYVDVMAFSSYNFGVCVQYGVWGSPSYVLDSVVNDLANINPTKPILVAQTGAPKSCTSGSTGGNQAQWVRDLFDHVRAQENVAGFIWFNAVKFENFGVTMDWRIWDPNWVSPGWDGSDGIAGADHKWPLSDWFAPGPLTIKPPALEEGTRPCSSAPCDSVGLVDPGGEWSLWSALSADANRSDFYFGNPGDIPFMGDWDGDGVATPGLYRQSDGFVYLRNSNTQGVANTTFFFGNPGDYPLIGDFNNDGKDTVSIFRSSEAKVYIVNKLGQNGGGLGKADFSYSFGNPGDKPFVGDFNGNGQSTVGLYRTSTGFVYFRNTLNTGIAHLSFFYGNPGDVILAGDWDGDGDDTVAVYRPSTSRVYVNLQNAAGNADYTLWVGSFPHAVTWGRE
jgi:Glycosyl hydrolase family 26